MAQEDLISIMISQPYLWIILALVVVYFIVSKVREGKTRPEEEPFYGVKVREEMTKEQVTKRADTWGTKSKLHLRRGFDRIGKILRTEIIYKYEKDNPKVYKNGKKRAYEPVENRMEHYHLITFRHYGFVAWVMAQLGRKKHLLLSPEVITVDNDIMIIDPKAFLINDSGIWIYSNKRNISIVDDLNLKKDLENYKGFMSDMPRRLSNIHPSQAIYTERQELDANLQEQSKKNRISRWVSG